MGWDGVGSFGFGGSLVAWVGAGFDALQGAEQLDLGECDPGAPAAGVSTRRYCV